MTLELDHKLDLRALQREAPLRVVYSFIEPGEYESTLNLIPLSTAINLGLAKKVQTPDENTYIVTPSEIGTTDGKAEVNVVSAQWRTRHIEKEMTTCDFNLCVSCGGPVVPENSEVTTETTPCQHCGTSNHSIGSQVKTILEQELEVEEVFEQVAYEGTPEQLRHERDTFEANQHTTFGRLKNMLTNRSELAPIEVIKAGEEMVGPNEKITYTGPFSDSEQDDLFVQIGDLQARNKPTHAIDRQVSGDHIDSVPKMPSSYLIEQIDINERGDYLVIVESDSGKRLPLIILVDSQRKPSRFAIPLLELMITGWHLSLPISGIDLNQIIVDNGMDKLFGPSSTEDRSGLGLVRVFKWDNTSDRHDEITDALYDYDLPWDINFVSADIPEGKVSLLYVIQT